MAFENRGQASPVDAKIGVQRENLPGRVDFRESNQTGVCQ
jgi:hypothetical protein